MAIEGLKWVEVAGVDDTHQITAMYAVLLSGNFLLLQLVYEGKTTSCHPAIGFPEGFYVTHATNHWCNGEIMISYIEAVIVTYIAEKRLQLGLDSKHSGLIILKGKQPINLCSVNTQHLPPTKSNASLDC